MLLRNSLLNLVGSGAPLIVALLTIPFLIESLGLSRFGILTLIWAVVSYFSLFDLGLGRALTLEVSVAISQKKEKQLPQLIGTAYLMMLVLGVLSGLLMYVSAEKIVGVLQDIPNYQETIYAIYALALAVPFVIISAGFRGVLEAHHAFGLVNLVKLPLGIMTFLAPVLVILLWGKRLDLIAWSLLAVRVLGALFNFLLALYVLPKEYRSFEISKNWLRPLLINGGWMTVSNIVNPLMGYVDRFMIGSLISAAAVAFYATPNEIVTKLWIIPGALTAVLFPTFAAQILQNKNDARQLYKKAILLIFWSMLPIVVFLGYFSEQILTVWINAEFSSQAQEILKIFAIGIIINSLAHVPFTIIQSCGKARIAAIIHLIEFPFFIVLLWWLISVFGTIGAAYGWLVRIVIDTILMFVFSMKIIGLEIKPKNK